MYLYIYNVSIYIYMAHIYIYINHPIAAVKPLILGCSSYLPWL